jgi:sugar phosphate isomerase/epimerase
VLKIFNRKLHPGIRRNRPLLKKLEDKKMFSAVTISLVPEARGGPFVFWDGLEAGCQRAAALGFDAVEVFPRSPEELDARALKQLLDSLGLRLAAMGTGAGWVVRKLRLTDPDAGVRQRATEFAAGIVDLAGGLGAPAIIGSMQGRSEDVTARDHALDFLAEAIEQLASRAAKYGVPLLIEPLNRYETNLLNNVADTLRFLARLRAPNVMLLCDLFHMNIEEADIAKALHKAGSKLGHIHFADSNRQAVGFGHIDTQTVAKVLRDAGFSGALSAEILPLPDSETAAAKTMEAFRALFPERSHRD